MICIYTYDTISSYIYITLFSVYIYIYIYKQYDIRTTGDLVISLNHFEEVKRYNY